MRLTFVCVCVCPKCFIKKWLAKWESASSFVKHIEGSDLEICSPFQQWHWTHMWMDSASQFTRYSQDLCTRAYHQCMYVPFPLSKRNLQEWRQPFIHSLSVFHSIILLEYPPRSITFFHIFIQLVSSTPYWENMKLFG